TEHPGTIIYVAASPDGRWIAAASADGTVQLSPVGPGESRRLRGQEGDVNKLTFSRDGRWLFLMGSERAAARLWEVDGDAARVLTGPGDLLDGDDGDVSPDGSLVALARRDGTVSLWSVASGTEVRALGRHVGKVGVVAFSPDGRW